MAHVQRIQLNGSPATGVAFKIRNDQYTWEAPARLNQAMASLLNRYHRNRWQRYIEYRRHHGEAECTLFLYQLLAGKAGYFGLIDFDDANDGWSEFGWIKPLDNDAEVE